MLHLDFLDNTLSQEDNIARVSFQYISFRNDLMVECWWRSLQRLVAGEPFTPHFEPPRLLGPPGRLPRVVLDSGDRGAPGPSGGQRARHPITV